MYIISRWSMIVRVSVALNGTVVDRDCRFSKLCGSHLQSQRELYHVTWWLLTLDIDQTGQKRRDVFGRLPIFFLREGGGCTQAIMLLPLRALNVISAFRSVFRYSWTVVYCLSNCRLSSHFIVVIFAWVRQEVGCTVPVTVDNDSVV